MNNAHKTRTALLVARPRIRGNPKRDTILYMDVQPICSGYGDVVRKSYRNQQVILDSDVAELYGVETKRVNEAVRNNPEKFPEGYVWVLSGNEKNEVVENFDHLQKLKFSPQFPKAFTEKGLYNNRKAILAQASASARAWWWLSIGQPQAAATVCSWWLGNRRPKRLREARHVQKN